MLHLPVVICYTAYTLESAYAGIPLLRAGLLSSKKMCFKLIVILLRNLVEGRLSLSYLLRRSLQDDKKIRMERPCPFEGGRGMTVSSRYTTATKLIPAK